MEGEGRREPENLISEQQNSRKSNISLFVNSVQRHSVSRVGLCVLRVSIFLVAKIEQGSGKKRSNKRKERSRKNLSIES